MRKLLRNKKGFTLVELMVVVIIVGILAAVAVPLYRTNLKRAMSSEGVALVGSVRTAERVYFAEHNKYTGVWADLGGALADISGNKYFTTAPVFTLVTATTFTATVTGSGDAAGITASVDQAGNVTVGGL